MGCDVEANGIANESAAVPEVDGFSSRPRNLRPILVVGTGGIVRAAHLPAYRKADYPVVGLMDLDQTKASQLAAVFGIRHTFASLEEAVRFAPEDVAFDVAVPAAQLRHILPELPRGATVLMQKPMGETLVEAQHLLQICKAKEFIAAVNFTLRYSPNHLAIMELAGQGRSGEVHSVEAQIRTFTPWYLWPFLEEAPRLEIL